MATCEERTIEQLFTVSDLDTSCLDAEKEAELSRNASPDKLKMFIRHHSQFFADRLICLPAARPLVRKVFDEFVPAGAFGAEFGAGACGAFYNLLLPHQFRGGWKQYEIISSLVAENRKGTKDLFGEDANVMEGNIYEMPLADASTDLILGLSSWDSITRFDKAVSETKRCLKQGWLFIHLQDILPSKESILVAEFLEREKLKQQPSCLCYTVRNDDGEFVTDISSVVDKGKMVRAGRYLTNHLANICSNNGFSLLLNDELTNAVILSCDDYFGYISSFIGEDRIRPLKKFVRSNASISYRNGKLQFEEDFSLEGKIRLTYSADVLVAKK
jgi:ubiquinone/menaquinone biosynthesis C-methylase UbiE